MNIHYEKQYVTITCRAPSWRHSCGLCSIPVLPVTQHYDSKSCRNSTTLARAARCAADSLMACAALLYCLWHSSNNRSPAVTFQQLYPMLMTILFLASEFYTAGNTAYEAATPAVTTVKGTLKSTVKCTVQSVNPTLAWKVKWHVSQALAVHDKRELIWAACMYCWLQGHFTGVMPSQKKGKEKKRKHYAVWALYEETPMVAWKGLGSRI